MSEIIREITEDDFQEVSKLYEFGNDINELKWLYRDIDSSKKYNCFVAINDKNQIVGAIGYWLFEYYQNKTKALGIFPVNWIVKSDYKGMAGILLFKKVSEKGDINVIVEGTNIAQKIFPMFKYQVVAHNNYYYKALSVFGFYKSLSRSGFFKKTLMFFYLIPSFFKNISNRAIDKGIKFIPYDGQNYIQEPEHNDVFKKRITKNYIDWLIECPSVKPLAFSVKKDDVDLGMCVLYLKKHKKTYKGRIVHMPYLKEDKKIWISFFNQCVKILKQNKCSFVTNVTLNSMASEALEKNGFIKIKRHSQPIHFKDKNNILPKVKIDKWHFQFTDGEISFRNF